MNEKVQNFNLSTYRLLGQSGLRVSPLCLGTMTFGTEWGWGADKTMSRAMLEMYLERGGNFVDTANFYTGGASEEMLGEFLGSRRQRIVLSTKYSMSMHRGDPNAGGNARKNLVQSLEESLRRLRTDYIDLYWVHIWDGVTPVEEVMRALDDQVRAGKLLYVGVSDTPAWKVAQANTLAALRGWSPFVALQLEYSLIERTVERELLPMAMELEIGVVAWSPLGGGLLTGKYSSEQRRPPAELAKRDLTKKLTDRNLTIAAELRAVAADWGLRPSHVALQWLLRRPGVTSPIVGARTPAQLEENLDALGVTLPELARERLDAVSAIEPDFPGRFMGSEFVRDILTGGTRLSR